MLASRPDTIQTKIKEAVDTIGVLEVARRLDLGAFTVLGLAYGLEVKPASRDRALIRLHKLGAK